MTTSMVVPKFLSENIQSIRDFLGKKMNEATGAIIQIQKSKPHTFPFKLPAGTSWESIIINFKNDYDVEIHVRDIKHPTGFADMGFADKRRLGEPTEQWWFLELLARKNRILLMTDPEWKQEFVKRKELLSAQLKHYFNIDSDPFESYKRKKAYVIKMTVFKQDEVIDIAPKKSKNERISEEVLDIFGGLNS